LVAVFSHRSIDSDLQPRDYTDLVKYNSNGAPPRTVKQNPCESRLHLPTTATCTARSITMRSLILIFAIGLIGCRKEEPRTVPEHQASPSADTSQREFIDALRIAESENPALILASWQAEWRKGQNYREPREGVFETERFGFQYRWEFAERNVTLTVSEHPNLDEEDAEQLYMFVTELDSEWRLGPRFLKTRDRTAGSEACAGLRELIVNEAIRLEETTPGAIYPDAFPESKTERLEMLKGPNKHLAMSLAYRTLEKSGTISGKTIEGDLFAFMATAHFDIDGTISATLHVSGKR
jgi:hypothetical protein